MTMYRGSKSASRPTQRSVDFSIQKQVEMKPGLASAYTTRRLRTIHSKSLKTNRPYGFGTRL